MPKKGYGDSLLVTAVSLLTRYNACHAAELSRSLVEWMWVGGMNVQNAAQLRPLYPFPLLHRNMNARGGSGFQSHKCTAALSTLTDFSPPVSDKMTWLLLTVRLRRPSTRHTAESTQWCTGSVAFNGSVSFPFSSAPKTRSWQQKHWTRLQVKKTASKWEPEFFWWLKYRHFSDRA